MSANPNTRAINNSVNTSGGLVWNRLHSEREDICEALLRDYRPNSQVQPKVTTGGDAIHLADWHRELLQARLRKIDGALDRLMSGTYGDCSRCGRWIQDTKLDFDPAVEFCIECWQHQQPVSRADGSIGKAVKRYPALIEDRIC